MRFRNAKKLHNEDEVEIKHTRCVQRVVEIEVEEKDVFVRCDDGVLYHHTAIR